MKLNLTKESIEHYKKSIDILTDVKARVSTIIFNQHWHDDLHGLCKDWLTMHAELEHRAISHQELFRKYRAVQHDRDTLCANLREAVEEMHKKELDCYELSHADVILPESEDGKHFYGVKGDIYLNCLAILRSHHLIPKEE